MDVADAAFVVEAGDADFVIICTNTMHKVADEIQAQISIPILHIADAIAEVLLADGINKVGLLGTRFTMEQDFYKQRITANYPIKVIVPSLGEQILIHDVIYQELYLDTINPQSRQSYLGIIDKFYEQGTEAVILGCTEIALLVQQQHTHVPLYDTTQLHANSAAMLVLAK